jgi:hypothetical protein
MEKVVLFYKRDPKITPAARAVARVLGKKCRVTLLESRSKLKVPRKTGQGKYDLMVAVGSRRSAPRHRRCFPEITGSTKE